MAVKTKYPPCHKCGDPHAPPDAVCRRYNGWANYETWAVNLWLTNDEGTYSYWRERAADAKNEENWPEHDKEWFKKKTFTRYEIARGLLSRWLKEELEEQSAEVFQSAFEASLWSDLLGGALSEVNWFEVAEHFLEE